MKKLIGSSLAVFALAMTSNAALLLDEPFSYPDGSLTNVSADWVTHSGSGGPIQVLSGRVELRAGNGTLPTGFEDSNRLIPTGPFEGTTNLYASFIVNFSEAPAAGTEYFAHFKDSGNGFRCRVFVTTNGAAPGTVRFGIRNFSSDPVEYLAQDVALNADAKIVLRYQAGTNDAPNSTLWVNPSSEASPNVVVNTNETPVNSYVGAYSFALRQANNIGILQLDDLKVGTTFADVSTIGGPPSIIGLNSTNIPANSSTGPMPFLIADVETHPTNLTVAATSDNITLVPNNPANLVLAGTDTNRTLNVIPAVSQQGTANIMVVVTDGSGDKATNSFTLTVGQPNISSIADQTVLAGSIKAVNFWVNDTETAPGSLTVTATSSDQGVLSDSNIGVINSGNTNRTLQLTNTTAGVTVVTVTVSDGTFNIPTMFNLTVSPDNGILLAENFNYADGSIITNSAFLWSPNTGTTGQAQIVSGKLLITSSGSEDLYRWFTNAPYADTSGQLIFTRFIVNFSALPTSSGSYFQHTYAFGGAYKARVFSGTSGAAAGKLRLSISNGGSTPQAFPVDLSTNQPYVVITRYNTATSESTLWVNPASISSTSVSGIDGTATTTTYGVSFRQASGIGSMSIDDLLVGSTFSQVFTNLAPPAPTPESITYQVSGSDLILNWTNPAFKLATGTEVTGITNVISTTSPYTNSLSDPQRYFRLVYP